MVFFNEVSFIPFLKKLLHHLIPIATLNTLATLFLFRSYSCINTILPLSPAGLLVF